jgi:hypothetical protein
LSAMVTLGVLVLPIVIITADARRCRTRP